MGEEINFEEFKFVFDFDKNKSFNCTRCGMCCMSITDISLSCIEVNRITGYLDKKVNTREFEGFVWDILAFLQRPDFAGNKKVLEVEKMKIYNFYTYGGSVDVDGKLYLLSYALKNLAPTNRCPFYNPVKAECLIYPVRPHVCRMFPFIIQLNQKKKIMHASLLNPMCRGLNTSTANRKELEKQWHEIGLGFFKDGFEHEKMLKILLAKYSINIETLLETTELQIRDPKEVYLEHMKNIKTSKDELKDFVLTPANFIDIFFENGMVKKPNMMLRDMLEKGIKLK